MRPGAATIWGFGAVIAIAISLPHLPSIERLDYLALDWQFQLLRQWRERPLSPDVVIVGIDDDTFAALPEPIRNVATALGSIVSSPGRWWTIGGWPGHRAPGSVFRGFVTGL